MPSEVLEEMVSATILRLAKERFTKRGLSEQAARGTAGRRATASSHSSPPPPPLPPDSGPDEETKPNFADLEVATPAEEVAGFVPVVSAADDVSYELARPATRRILARLDRTLTVLHNARVAGLSYLTDSSATNTPDTDSEGPPGSRSSSRRQRPRSASTGRKRGRPRSRAPAPAPKPRSGEASDAGSAKSRRGRPRKQHFPREGETEKEMLIRVARENHRRLPVFPDDESSETEARRQRKREQAEEEDEEAFESMAEQSDGSAKDEKETKKKEKGKQRQRRLERRPRESTKEFLARIARDRHQRLPSFPDDDDSSDSAAEQEKPHDTESARGSKSDLNRASLLSRWALRDWSDVVGAAALAGFSPEVIDRTAQRCASLFGQSMTMSTFSEVPAGARGGGQLTRSYPAPHLERDPSGSEDEDMIGSSQMRIVSRQSSMAPPGSPSSSSTGDKNRAGDLKRRRRRNSSAASLVGRHYCSFEDCSRALQGFSRRFNLVRHMRLVHGVIKQEAGLDDEPGGAEGDDEADDGLEGAVHVDGFLQPIWAQKGWRSEDIGPRRERRSQSRGRSRSRASRDTDEEISVT